MEKKTTFAGRVKGIALAVMGILVVGTLLFGSFVFVRNMIHLISK